MSAKEIALQIQQRLRAAQCPSHRKGMEGYFTTGMSFLGVKTPVLRGIVK
ncbi:MAG: DNA alkylation repair protein, partial [Deltaproteobacteria bacterium]|nr:DNA alkylation repair protein [Deltaproteobacteria bacterium]